MRYIKFTYVDSVTGISVVQEPAISGPVQPEISGLQFVWARESEYPTNTPAFFGTCDDNADISVSGVLGEFSQEDWNNMRADEMLARVPQKVSRRQAVQAMLMEGIYDLILQKISEIPDPLARRLAQAEFDESQVFERQRPLVISMGALAGLDSDGLDRLFIKASKL